MKRVVVDRHLGHLARWLRTLGYDAFFQVDASAQRMRSEVGLEETVFVTTDCPAPETFGARSVLLVPKDDLGRQLRALRQALPGPWSGGMFTRCVICNMPVETVAKESVKEAVPEAVYARAEAFTACPTCGRVYWEGTHTARLRRRLASLLGESTTGGSEEPPAPSSPAC